MHQTDATHFHCCYFISYYQYDILETFAASHWKKSSTAANTPKVSWGKECNYHVSLPALLSLSLTTLSSLAFSLPSLCRLSSPNIPLSHGWLNYKDTLTLMPRWLAFPRQTPSPTTLALPDGTTRHRISCLVWWELHWSIEGKSLLLNLVKVIAAPQNLPSAIEYQGNSVLWGTITKLRFPFPWTPVRVSLPRSGTQHHPPYFVRLK